LVLKTRPVAHLLLAEGQNLVAHSQDSGEKDFKIQENRSSEIYLQIF